MYHLRAILLLSRRVALFFKRHVERRGPGFLMVRPAIKRSANGKTWQHQQERGL
jgi:hypothetical protein